MLIAATKMDKMFKGNKIVYQKIKINSHKLNRGNIKSKTILTEINNYSKNRYPQPKREHKVHHLNSTTIIMIKNLILRNLETEL